jgi:DnaJ-domain-containing protein 1
MRKARTEYPRGLGVREEEPAFVAHPCEHPGCVADGPFRAPKARNALNEFRWFCLEHVREYNARWNYFAGMSPEEVERQTRADTTWQRPTWRLGQFGPGFRPEGMSDPFGLFRDAHPRAAPEAPPTRQVGAAERRALNVMDLEPSTTLKEIKMRYKELVKRFHPDVNQGDKDAEERLKQVIQAYNHLLTCGYS